MTNFLAQKTSFLLISTYIASYIQNCAHHTPHYYPTLIYLLQSHPPMTSLSPLELYWNDPMISSTPIAVNPALENEPFKAYITFLENWKLDGCWENAMTQYDMNMCAGQQIESSDQMLTQFLKEHMASLNPEEQQKLQEVQELWEQYKQKDCDRVLETYNGGSIGPMNYALCLDMHNRHRLESLVSECRSQ